MDKKDSKLEAVIVVCTLNSRQVFQVLTFDGKKLTLQETIRINQYRISKIDILASINNKFDFLVVGYSKVAQRLMFWEVTIPKESNSQVFEIRKYKEFNQKGILDITSS